MLKFFISWIIATVGIKILLHVKDIKTPFNRDIIAIALSFIILIFLNLIQLLFDFILNFFI